MTSILRNACRGEAATKQVDYYPVDIGGPLTSVGPGSRKRQLSGGLTDLRATSTRRKAAAPTWNLPCPLRAELGQRRQKREWRLSPSVTQNRTVRSRPRFCRSGRRAHVCRTQSWTQFLEAANCGTSHRRRYKHHCPKISWQSAFGQRGRSAPSASSRPSGSVRRLQ